MRQIEKRVHNAKLVGLFCVDLGLKQGGDLTSKPRSRAMARWDGLYFEHSKHDVHTGRLRTSDGRVGCTSAAGLAGIVSCDEGFRPTLDFAMPADSDSLFTSTCASLDDAPDDVFDSLEMDDGN